MEEKRLASDTFDTASDSSSFFPAIQDATKEEAEQIDRLIQAAEQPLPPVCAPVLEKKDEAEEVVYFSDEEESDEKGESNPEPASKKKNDLKPIPHFEGLISSARKKYADSPFLRTFFVGALGLLFGLILLLLITLTTAIYAICIVTILCAALVLLLLCVALIAAGIGDLCYGIVLLFTQGVVVGLLEIGLALVLFAIITALSALIGELVTGQLPKLIRKLSRAFLYLLCCLIAFVFGSDKFTDNAAAKEGKQ